MNYLTGTTIDGRLMIFNARDFKWEPLTKPAKRHSIPMDHFARGGAEVNAEVNGLVLKFTAFYRADAQA